MSWSVVILLSFIVIIGSSDHIISTEQKKEVSITYTGNMGVLIKNEKVSVWVDGLHEFYGPQYLNPPDSILLKAFAGKNGFRNLQLLLFTHFHRDHFSASLVKRILRGNQKVKVGGAPQVTDSFNKEITLRARNKNGDIFKDDIAELKVQAYDIPHTWQERHNKVQNQAYLMDISGIHILHLGDAGTEENAFRLLTGKKIDVAIVPLWFLLDESGVKILKNTGATRIIATHIAPGSDSFIDPGKLPHAEIQLFKKPGESVIIATE